MADWDVIAKQRLTEDWATLRAAYLPLNQAMRRTVEFLDKGGGTFDELLSVVRERDRRGAAQPDRADEPPLAVGPARGDPQPARARDRDCAARPPTTRARCCATCSRSPSCSATSGATRRPRARVTENLVVEGALDFWFGCDCCAVGKLRPARPDDPPDLLRGREVQLIWDVDALFAWTLDEFEDYLASERYALPTTPRIAATEDLGLPVVDIPSEALRRGNEWFGGQGGGLYVPLDLKYIE